MGFEKDGKLKGLPGGETNEGRVNFLIILSPSPLLGGDLFAAATVEKEQQYLKAHNCHEH